jgi:hypothetical protein
MSEIDQAAELFVANVFVRNGWDVYFPHKDKGFDFIITKKISEDFIIRPVQVKGKYPTIRKTRKRVYGFVGPISTFNEDMVLAIPFYESIGLNIIPAHIAYMPFLTIRKKQEKYRCEPCRYEDKAIPRREYIRFFDEDGIKNIENKAWRRMNVIDTEET